MMTRKSLRESIKSHASDAAVLRALPVAIAVMLIVYGNYAIMKPTNSKFPPHVDFVQEPDNVTVARPLPPPLEYPVARGSALDFYLDGAWQAGTVTSVQEQSRTFVGILANGTIVNGMAHDDFNTTWRLPCMGNKPGDKSLARTRLPNGPKTSPVPQLTDQFLDRFIVVPEYKLLFCYVEKVGCSMFNLVFRYLRLMHPNMTKEEAEHLLGVPPGMSESTRNWFKNTPEHHKIGKGRLQRILANKQWTKAFFYRDPVSRYVSAFRSKCDKFDEDGFWHCREAFLDGNITFPKALYQMTQPGINHLSANPHFASYGTFCGGLDQTLDYYDIVQPLDPKTVGSLLRTMFDRVRVDSATADVLIKEVVDSRGRLSSDIAQVKDRWGLEPDFGVTEQHNTNSGNVFNDYMSSPESVRIVQDFYASDYALFRSPKASEEKFCPA